MAHPTNHIIMVNDLVFLTYNPQPITYKTQAESKKGLSPLSYSMYIPD